MMIAQSRGKVKEGAIENGKIILGINKQKGNVYNSTFNKKRKRRGKLVDKNVKGAMINIRNKALDLHERIF